MVWFGKLIGPKQLLIPLKLIIASLELNLGTILCLVGLGRVGFGRSKSDDKAILSPAGAVARLSLAIVIKCPTIFLSMLP